MPPRYPRKFRRLSNRKVEPTPLSNVLHAVSHPLYPPSYHLVAVCASNAATAEEVRMPLGVINPRVYPLESSLSPLTPSSPDTGDFSSE